MEPLSLYLTLLLTGFVLIGFEIFIPGGILGLFGSVAWIGAAVVGVRNFSAPWNMVSALVLLAFGILTFIVWIRYFPKSRVGKSLSLEESTANYKSHDSTRVEVGAQGEAGSILRPSGIAIIDGQRIDVVADGEWIEAGEPIRVSSTNGGHVSVVKA